MARRSRKKQRVPSLSEDLIVEILSRVPYRSLCRFKCVSRSWLALCSDPDLRKKSPQTLSGFFCFSRHEDEATRGLRFLNRNGRGRPLVDPSPPFLEGYAPPMLVQCCSSLLLWRVWRSSPFEPEYVVSNPATQKWILLPPTEASHYDYEHCVCLGFDPAVPSCFYVFMFVTTDQHFGVEIYSSKTGRWIFRLSEWEECITLDQDRQTVFFNGTLYCATIDSSLASVDAEGKTWRNIRMPWSYIQLGLTKDDSLIMYSQGRLCAMCIDFHNDNQLAVWVLGANVSEQWTLKHTVNISQLFGRHHRSRYEFYTLIAAHPEHNLIFLSGGLHGELMSYDMDKQETQSICSLQGYYLVPCLPYIPSFAEWSLPLHMVTES